MNIEQITSLTAISLKELNQLVNLPSNNNDAVLMINSEKIKNMVSSATEALTSLSEYLAPMKTDIPNVSVQIYNLAQRKKALVDMCIACANLSIHPEKSNESLNPLCIETLSILNQHLVMLEKASLNFIDCKRELGHD